MKVRLVDSGEYLQCVAERLHSSSVVRKGADIAFHNSILASNGPSDGVDVNTSTFLRQLAGADKELEKLWRVLGIEEEEPDTLLYCLCNGRDYSPMIEVAYTKRLMNNDVGPDLTMTTGASLTVEYPLEIPGVARVLEFLREADYRGEIGIGLKRNTKEFVPDVCMLTFGHSGALFAMYLESMSGDADEALAFMAGRIERIRLHDCFCLAILLSLEDQRPLVIPAGSNKHVWRTFGPSGQAAFYVAHANKDETQNGLSQVGVARKRVYRNLSIIARTERDVRYRTDGGFDCSFLLNRERYEKAMKRS